MKRTLSAIPVAVILLAFGYLTAGAEESLTGKELVMKKIKDGALVVDVRTPAEFEAGHYPGAVNIPLSGIPSRLGEFGAKSRPIVVYCRSGNRSARAKAILEGNGFTDVTNGGGLRAMPAAP